MRQAPRSGVLLQISAGTGPREARIFVAALADALTEHCAARKLEVRTRAEIGAPEAPRSVALELPIRARAELTPLLGTHELTMARTRAKRGRRRGGERKRWFVGVTLHPLPTASLAPSQLVQLLDPAELELRFDRAGGPGGQHVNTCASAVRLVHKPTRLAVRVANERSQHRNRELALERLAALLAVREREAAGAAKSERHLALYDFERGSAVASWRFGGARDQGLVKT